jgi:hypothetical protein
MFSPLARVRACVESGLCLMGLFIHVQSSGFIAVDGTMKSLDMLTEINPSASSVPILAYRLTFGLGLSSTPNCILVPNYTIRCTRETKTKGY